MIASTNPEPTLLFPTHSLGGLREVVSTRVMDLFLSRPRVLPALKRSDGVDDAPVCSLPSFDGSQEGTIQKKPATRATVQALPGPALVHRQDQACGEPLHFAIERSFAFLDQALSPRASDITASSLAFSVRNAGQLVHLSCGDALAALVRSPRSTRRETRWQ